ncbi:MAG: DUF2306 domain-containing protein, partial [Xanthomonadales bacterium]|nr:DUF2306 domain-containing protein [Xanthomonadales bacterium]
MKIIRKNQRLPRPALLTIATLGWPFVLYLCWVVGVDCIERSMFALATLSGEITQIDPFQDRYIAHPWQTLVHTVLGVIFATLGPLQFASPVRTRFPVIHRWSGRILVPSAILVGIASITIGLTFPVWGDPRNWIIVVASGAFMVFAFGRGLLLARQKRFLLHREWMIRGFATGIAVAWFRVMLDEVLMPSGWDFNTAWNTVMWT